MITVIALGLLGVLALGIAADRLDAHLEPTHPDNTTSTPADPAGQHTDAHKELQ